MVFYEQNATEAEVLPYYYAEDRIVQPGFYLKLPQVYQNTVRYYFSTMGFLSLKFPYLVSRKGPDTVRSLSADQRAQRSSPDVSN